MIENEPKNESAPSFDDLGLTEEVRRAIEEMGFADPTPVQVATYTPAAEGRDLVVQARTGTGKTAAFGIPLVDRLVKAEGVTQALILAPTRELALQSAKEVQRLGQHRGIETAAVYGGAPIERQVRELASGAQIVSGTPGRVLDHLKRGTLDPDGLRILVLDEADEMLSMGFAKELNAIVALLPARRQTMLFSATVPDSVERMGQRILRDPEYVSLSSDAVGAQGISHYYYLVSGLGRSRDLIRILENEDPESAIVFCNTRVVTEYVAQELQAAGFQSDWLNGDLPQSEREKVLSRTRKGQLRYLVATDVAARGIDISHLTHVINYDFPADIQAYIHRTGRTGRAGRTGTAISLVSPQELGSLYYLRLQYKLFPVERTLPSEGELQTRLEVDRIALLADALNEPIDSINLAVARRLVAHPDAERLVGNLLRAFFGSKESVDEEAAAARRERSPSSGDARAAATASTAADSTGRVGEVAFTGETDEGDSELGDDSDITYLYLNLGRRDGLRPGEIIRLLAEECQLDKGDVGRIRIRDRHTFVGVPTPRVDDIVHQLAGKHSHDKELVVEPAREQP